MKKGIPLRIEIGGKEQAANSVYLGRRDRAYRDKTSLSRQEFIASVRGLLDEIQQYLFAKAAKVIYLFDGIIFHFH